MIVGHCPECGQPIQGHANGNAQACIHTPPVLLILAGLFGEAFERSDSSAAGGESK